MAWILLVGAGLLEVGWASLLPATNGLRAPLPTAGFAVMLAGSMVALAVAARTIPIGTAYGVWVGIGALGAVLVGIVWHGDPAPPLRLLFVSLLVVAIVGLKVTGSQ